MNQTKSERPKLFLVPNQNAMSITCSVTPLKIVGSAPPRRPTNESARAREYFLPEEIDALRAAVQSNRYPVRDEAIIVMSYRHALRVSELVGLRWKDIDPVRRTIHIRRKKRRGEPAEQVHQMANDEWELLSKLQVTGEYIFMSERGQRLSKRTVHDIVSKADERANLGLAGHPHMLRHSRGFVLANRGTDTRLIQEYFGHASIKSTQIYTPISPERFIGCEQG